MTPPNTAPIATRPPVMARPTDFAGKATPPLRIHRYYRRLRSYSACGRPRSGAHTVGCVADGPRQPRHVDAYSGGPRAPLPALLQGRRLAGAVPDALGVPRVPAGV